MFWVDVVLIGLLMPTKYPTNNPSDNETTAVTTTGKMALDLVGTCSGFERLLVSKFSTIFSISPGLQSRPRCGFGTMLELI